MSKGRNVGVRFIEPGGKGDVVGVQFIEPVKELPKRKEIRLRSYDYTSDGYYFVTICTHRGKPHIRQHSKVVEQILLSLPQRFSGLDIDWHVLMPTHIHAIITFHGMDKSLPEVVRTFKALVTRETGVKFWQRNYYEHVIRTERVLLKIREYIENNPSAERLRFEEFYESGSDESDPYKNAQE
jgi:putative transposase